MLDIEKAFNNVDINAIKEALLEELLDQNCEHRYVIFVPFSIMSNIIAVTLGKVCTPAREVLSMYSYISFPYPTPLYVVACRLPDYVTL